MPIIESVNSDVPLSQGDILVDIVLYSTAEPWVDKGREVRAPFKMCLVLSRPCVLAHKGYLIVAGIDRYQDQKPKGTDTFDKYLNFLTTMRDGEGSPDRFYLGHLPRCSGRFCACLDSIHTIQIPKIEDSVVMRSFLSAKRIGILHQDFVRDLHARIFRVFASLGFDDHRWFSTDDLEVLVARGENDLLACKKVLQDKVLEDKSQKAQGGGSVVPAKVIAEAEEAVRSMEDKLRPYQCELERRGKPQPNTGESA